MSGVVQQMLANPTAFLPENYQWAEPVPVPEEEQEVQKLSPCCKAVIGGVLTDTTVIGLCRKCGCVIGEYDLVNKSIRLIIKKAEVAA